MPEEEKEEAEGQDEQEAQEGAENAAEEEEKRGSLFGPEGVMMLTMAAILDLSGLLELIPFVGVFLSWITDIAGTLIIVSWLLFRSHRVAMAKRSAKKMQHATGWMKRMKWLRPVMVLLEYIPGLGLFTWWTLLVYSELKD